MSGTGDMLGVLEMWDSIHFFHFVLMAFINKPQYSLNERLRRHLVTCVT